jgi:hypothetical protein
MFRRLMIAVVNSLWGCPQTHVSDRWLWQNPKIFTLSYALQHIFLFHGSESSVHVCFVHLTNHHCHHNLWMFIPSLCDSLLHFTPFFSVLSKVLPLFLWLQQPCEPNSVTQKMEAAYSSDTCEQTYCPVWSNKPEDCHLSSTQCESVKTFEIKAGHFIFQLYCL